MAAFILSPLWLLLASNVHAITIPSAPTWPSGRCTDKSLTIPSWVVTNYKVAGGKATFRVDNRATNSGGGSVECSTGKQECQSSTTADQIKVTWSDGANGNKVISFSQSWSCQDEGEKVNFAATGKTTITSCAGSDCTSPISYLAPGSLTLPVPLTPSQPSPPSGYSAPSCANVGKNQWTVSDVEFKNYTKGQCNRWYYYEQFCLDQGNPPYVPISRGQYLSLVVENNAISHNVTCAFNASPDNHNLPSPLRCTGGKFNEITLDVTFSGTAPNFNLKVEELWYCLENPSTNVKPSAIVASGNIPISMNCESSTGITGASDDIVTICTDRASSHAIDGVQVEKKSLDAYSLETAYPVHGGCTMDSIIKPTFYFRKMLFQTNAFSANQPNSVTLSRLTFGLSGPGFTNYFSYDSKPVSGSGINTVYSCNNYFDGKPVEQHWNCTYSFDPFTKVFSLDKVWQCDDKNAKQPIYFHTSGDFDWSKNPNSQCSTQNNNLYCYWNGEQANGEPGIPYPISGVTASLDNVLPPERPT